jgi:hypothetical protein
VKTERAIKNGQSRETGNIRYTRHNTKTNKTNTQHRKLKRYPTLDSTKNRGENTGASEGQGVPASYKTPAMLLLPMLSLRVQDNILRLSNTKN